MAVIKEWRCAAHGDFEGSHPICPALGCMSESVERVFLTAPAQRSGNDATARFDAGIKRTVDGMRLGNLRSARPGETSFAGRAQQEGSRGSVLWGSDIQKTLGRSMAQLAQSAAQPLNGQDVPNSGMRAAATEAGITARRTPVAERTVHRADSAKAPS